jgi:DUF4097 and DUF4098 domain-containing protein YvlB
MTKPRSLAAAIVLLALPLGAAQMTFVDRPITKTYPLDIAGTFWIDNPAGSIEITGGDGTNATITAVRTTIAVDRDAMAEARNNTTLDYQCNTPQMCFVRTIVPPLHNRTWNSSVKWTVTVPRTANVRILTKAADAVHVANVMGNVTVKSFSGTIALDNVTGASIVETVNGRVVYNYLTKPVSHAQISAINANIEIHAPAESNFDWVADTLRGDIWTTFNPRGRWSGRVFHGTINASGGPTITTSTMLGRVNILGTGLTMREARSVTALVQPGIQTGEQHQQQLTPQMMRVQIPVVTGPFVVAQTLADINIGEARGPLRVSTGAGAIELGTIFGDCTALSQGGPISIADAMQTLIAHTSAGNILVRAARAGGSITTDGGIVKVQYTGGATTLKSGGGDIIVSQAAGPIEAETRSGDITVTADPQQKTQKISARTSRGNVTVNLSTRFGADVDATVLTSDSDADAIYSDFSGLQIRKEQVGAKTRVRATGKINGGGERLELYAEDGTIHITSSAPAAKP